MMASATQAVPVAAERNGKKDNWYARDRLAGLRRFALAITTLNVLGHL